MHNIRYIMYYIHGEFNIENNKIFVYLSNQFMCNIPVNKLHLITDIQY